MRYPFPEYQSDFRKLVNAIDLRNQMARDAKECHDEYAHEEASVLLTMAEVAEAEAAKLVEELRL